MAIFVVGSNHNTATIEELESLYISGDELVAHLQSLISSGYLSEAVILSTCNRVEIYGVTSQSKESIDLVNSIFQVKSGMPFKRLNNKLYSFLGDAAVEHLFKVSASVDSMVVGETQILGQVKKAYEISRNSKSTGKIFNHLFPGAFKVAKKIRNQTDLLNHKVSVASLCVSMAMKDLSDLSNKSALLIGAGEMAEKAASYLLTHNIHDLYVYNRSKSRALLLAKKIGGTVVTDINQPLAWVDIAISSTSSSDLIIHKDQFLKSIKHRKNKPLFLIDLAVPRDIDPEIRNIKNINLYDMNDLSNIANKNREKRAQEAQIAMEIIKKDVLAFYLWLDKLKIEPLITDLKFKIEEMCVHEISKNIKRIKSAQSENDAIHSLAKSLTKKILHEPLTVLKKTAGLEKKYLCRNYATIIPFELIYMITTFIFCEQQSKF